MNDLKRAVITALASSESYLSSPLRANSGLVNLCVP